jgi:hypothetical protein
MLTDTAAIEIRKIDVRFMPLYLLDDRGKPECATEYTRRGEAGRSQSLGIGGRGQEATAQEMTATQGPSQSFRTPYILALYMGSQPGSWADGTSIPCAMRVPPGVAVVAAHPAGRVMPSPPGC